MTNSISQVLERFYICTNLPVMAIELEGNFLGSSGFNSKFTDIFEENRVFDKVSQWIQKKHDGNVTTIPCLNKSYFTACYIDPKNIHRGIFILGPHSCIKNNEFSIPYKPRCLMENLISLIYIIEKDLNNKRYLNNAYSYHIKKALDYIDSRYSRNISLDDIAEYLDINKTYFCSLLKRETGKTFTQILNSVRIEMSKNFLLEKNSSILNIALTVGFNSQNYYNITFKKITGMTPLEFREQS